MLLDHALSDPSRIGSSLSGPEEVSTAGRLSDLKHHEPRQTLRGSPAFDSKGRLLIHRRLAEKVTRLDLENHSVGGKTRMVSRSGESRKEFEGLLVVHEDLDLQEDFDLRPTWRDRHDHCPSSMGGRDGYSVPFPKKD